MSQFYKKVFIAIFSLSFSILQTTAWALLNFDDSTLSNLRIDQLHKELEKFEQKLTEPSKDWHNAIETLAPDLAPDMIDITDQEFPNLSQKQQENTLQITLNQLGGAPLGIQVSYGEGKRVQDFQYYAVKGLVHINTQWFLTGSYSSLDAISSQPKSPILYDRANNIEESNLERVAFGIGWQPDTNILAQVQIGENNFNASSPSTFPSKDRLEKRSFAGLETSWRF